MAHWCSNNTCCPERVEIVPDWEVLCRSLRHLGERHIAEQQILVTQFFQSWPQFLLDPDKFSECDVPADGCPDIPFATPAGRVNTEASERTLQDLANGVSTRPDASCIPAFPDTALRRGATVECGRKAGKSENPLLPTFLTKDAMKHVNLDVETNRFMKALQRFANKCILARHLLSCVDWCMSAEEPLRSGYLAQIVLGNFFAFLTLAVIIANSLFTIYTTNRTIQLSTETRTPVMQVVELFFLGFYCFELTLKIAVHRIHFFINAEYRWNIFDFVLVGLAIGDQVLMSTMNMESVDLTFMRTLRLLKLSKVLRMFRAMRFFAELRLMLDCVAGSVISLFWCFLTLGCFKVIFALIFVQSFGQLLLSDAKLSGQELSPTTRQQVLDKFGSVEVATLTLFKTTSGGIDWEEAYDLVQLCGSFPVVIFIFYIVFEVFAAVNIVTSLFVDKAMKLAQPDLEMLLMEKRRSDMKNANAIMDVCREADSNRSGSISYREFEQLMNDTRIRNMFELKGLDIKDADLFFRMLSGVDGVNEVDIDTFVAGCMKIKGVAMSVDLMSVSFELKMLQQREHQFRKVLAERLDMVMQLVKSISFPPAAAVGSISSPPAAALQRQI